MNIFTCLPDDILRFELFAYLDYEGRNALNRCLPFEARISTPLKKNAHNQIVMGLHAETIRKFLRKVEDKDKIKDRVKHVLKLYRSVNKFNYLIIHSSLFRKMFIEKCNSYMDENNEEYHKAPKYFKKTMMKLCSENIELINKKYPHKFDLQLIQRNEDWSAVQNRYVVKEGWRSK